MDDYAHVNIGSLSLYTGEMSIDELTELLQVFEQGLQVKLNELNQLIDDGQYASAQAITHALKSNARIIGAAKLTFLSEQFELIDVMDNDVSLFKTSANELVSEINEVIADLRMILNDRE